jgi:hypothetical protein
MNDANRSTVVVVCGDPGGANAMAPVLERLQSDGQVIARALAYREARTVWQRAGLKFVEIPEETAEEAASNLLLDNRARALAVGTSMNSAGLEKKFVRAARQLGTPSLAVLDFWSNYLGRFSDATGRLSLVPDLIAIMDDTARAEMLELGFDASRLVVTGQPAFDALPSLRTSFSAARRRRIRRALRVEPGALLVTFASQPLAAVFGTSPANPAYLGFTEHDVLAALLASLQGLAKQGVQLVLAVLPHPREDPGTFEQLSSGDLTIVVSSRELPREVVMSSDLVVGMNSVLLMEACYLGCPTLSLQPGLLQADSLPTNRTGISRPVYDAADIDSAVTVLLLDEESRRTLLQRVSDFQVRDVGAAARVAQLIYGMSDGTLPSGTLDGPRAPGAPGA